MEKMTRKGLVTGLVVMLTVVVGLSVGLPVMAMKKNEPQAGGLVSIETAISEFGIEPKQPTMFPFELRGTLGNVMELKGGARILQLDYVGETDWATLEVMTGNVSLGASDQDVIVRKKLKGGLEAEYLDNGMAKMLFWRDGDLSYHLSLHGKSKFSADDLVRMAESLAK